MVMKEWECAEHGTFECSDPICPALGCESELVERVFLTPPTISDGTLKRFDKGIKRSAELLHISNFRSARAGEAAYGGEAAKAAGMEVLWGDDVKRVLGRTATELAATTQSPLTVNGKTENVPNNGMRSAATEIGITKRRLPQAAEIVQHKSDVTMKKVKEIMS